MNGSATITTPRVRSLAIVPCERMLAEFGHELWIGHASEIRAAVVRKQKTDARDAAHLLRLLAENRFPRIWIPSPAERDTRQLLRTATSWFVFEFR